MKVEEILKDRPYNSTMMTIPQVTLILEELDKVLKNNVEGDIVELGCNAGITSTYIQQVLDINNSKKELHIYDSFCGLPEKKAPDIPADISNNEFHQGSMKVEIYNVIDNFIQAKVKMPTIHSGWFSEGVYPEKIAFALFDGDLYQSIYDSFTQVFPKLSQGGVVCIHDYGYHKLPGVKKACQDYIGLDYDIIETEHFVGIIRK